MNLRTSYAQGLTVEAYTRLLDEDQAQLHRLYERRADVRPTDIDAVRAAGTSPSLVITEPWCGDSLAIFPVVARLFSEAGFPIRVILRDERPDVMDEYLTDGARAIPIVIVMDERFVERFHWGPRPVPAQQIARQHKEDVSSGRMDKTEVHKKIRAFYARDRGRTIVDELIERLTAVVD